MPRPTLTDTEVKVFRQRLAVSSYQLFARFGTAGVTLRAVAMDLGVSPMTPYRYVADKAELLALGRAEVFRRFAEAQEAAITLRSRPLVRLQRLCRAYVAFALENSDGYRMMFSTNGAQAACPELAEQSIRSFRPLLDATKAAVECGLQGGDPVALAHLHWATVHGLVSLHLSGKLMASVSLERLCNQMLSGLTSHKRSRP